MLDHVLGRPSATIKRIQVIVYTCLSLYVLKKYDASGKPPYDALKRLAHGPVTIRLGRSRMQRFLDRVNKVLDRYAPWQILLGSATGYYVVSNLFLLLFLNAPEPMARMYTRSFFRATWFLTALDAGFWTAMNIRPIWLRDFLSIWFSIFYLLFPNQAEEKVKAFRAQATVEQMRYSWNKAAINPYLWALTSLNRPKLGVLRDLELPRPTPPSPSAFNQPEGKALPKIQARFYFAGTPEELKRCDALVLHFPGGGFLSMPPRCHEEYLATWAKRTSLPVLSIDYGKAPEYPYPWALEECFDAYRTVVETNGACIGMGGWYAGNVGGKRKLRKPIRIAVAGDSAGGNLAVAVVYKILEYSHHHLPAPSGVVLTYPALAFDMASWMPPDEIELLRAESRNTLQQRATTPLNDKGSQGDLRRHRTLSFVHDRNHRMSSTSLSSSGPARDLPKQALPEPVRGNKSQADLRAMYETTSPLALPPAPRQTISLYVDEPPSAAIQKEFAKAEQDRTTKWFWKIWDSLLVWRAAPSSSIPVQPTAHQSLSMTSRFAYSHDRTLPPELLRSMALLYLGNCPHPPNFQEDYFVSPIIGPDDLLARFPKVYLICGEKDPLVDDTVIFAGRLREAKARAHREWQKLMEKTRRDRKNGVNVVVEDSDDDSGPLTVKGGRSRKPSRPDQAWNTNHLESHLFARDPDDMVHTKILEGMSHGFKQMSALMPEAQDIVKLLGTWLLDCVTEDDTTPRQAPFPGYATTSGDDALAEEELTELMLRNMEMDEDETFGPEDANLQPHSRPGYYNAIPAQVHRYLNPESSNGAVHGQSVRQQWISDSQKQDKPDASFVSTKELLSRRGVEVGHALVEHKKTVGK